MSESFEALRRANPRRRAGFEQSVETVVDSVRARLATVEPVASVPRRRLLHACAAGAALAVVGVIAVSLTVGSPGGASAAAAVRKAATVSAASAERSGTAVLRITRNGELWGGTTIRWHGDELALAKGTPSRDGKVGSELRVVGGTMYGIDPAHGGWVMLGRPESIDPGSGTTPAEYLAAVREDVGGATLRRITAGMTELTTSELADGSTVYRGAVPAGLIARETGFKEGQAIRVLPFGYVAHDEAADPAAPLDVAVTVGTDGLVREIAVTWGTSASAWSYSVTYSHLGDTHAPVAPANARPDVRCGPTPDRACRNRLRAFRKR